MIPFALMCFCVPSSQIKKKAHGDSVGASERSQLLDNPTSSARSSVDTDAKYRRSTSSRSEDRHTDRDVHALDNKPSGGEGAQFFSDLKCVITNPVYFFACAGYGCYIFVVGGFSFWLADYLHVTMGQDENQASIMVGGVLCVTGLFGTGFGGWLTDVLARKRGGTHGVAGTIVPFEVSWVFTLIALPLGVCDDDDVSWIMF